MADAAFSSRSRGRRGWAGLSSVKGVGPYSGIEGAIHSASSRTTGRGGRTERVIDPDAPVLTGPEQGECTEQGLRR